MHQPLTIDCYGPEFIEQLGTSFMLSIRRAVVALAYISGVLFISPSPAWARKPPPITNPGPQDARLAKAGGERVAKGRAQLAKMLEKPLPAHEPGEVIVRYRDDTTSSERRDVRTHIGADVDDTALKLYSGRVELLKLPRSRDLSAALAELNEDADVAYAEPNYHFRLTAQPNDPFWPHQWQLGQVHASTAWDYAGGGGVDIAILDTGLDLYHTEFDGKISGMWDAVGEDGWPWDDQNHGTKVSGIALARAQNNYGIAGLAHWSNVIPIRVCSNTCALTDILEAFPHISLTGVRIVNMSFAGPTFSQILQDAIAARPEVLFVAPAGSGNLDLNGPNNAFPCSYPLPNIICVTASDSSGNRDLWSQGNYDSAPPGLAEVDVAAPVGMADGSSSAITTHSLNQGIGWSLFGTSFAAPIVSGTAAIILNMRPAWSVRQIRDLIFMCTNRLAGMVGVVPTGIVSAGCAAGWLGRQAFPTSQQYGGSNILLNTREEVWALVEAMAAVGPSGRQTLWNGLDPESKSHYIATLIDDARVNREGFGLSTSTTAVHGIFNDPTTHGTIRELGAPMTNAELSQVSGEGPPGPVYLGEPDEDVLMPRDQEPVPDDPPDSDEVFGPAGEDSTSGYGCDPQEEPSCRNDTRESDDRGTLTEQPSDDLPATAARVASAQASAAGATRSWFDRYGARADANAHAAPGTSRTGLFGRLSNDCTNFVSQVWHKGGGLNMTRKWFIVRRYVYREYTASWAAVRNFVDYMVNTRRIARLITATPSSAFFPSGTGIGDAVEYDWGEGAGWSHLAIVVGLSGRYHRISQHSTDRRDSSWRRGWVFQRNPAARARMRARIVHVTVR